MSTIFVRAPGVARRLALAAFILVAGIVMIMDDRWYYAFSGGVLMILMPMLIFDAIMTQVRYEAAALRRQ